MRKFDENQCKNEENIGVSKKHLEENFLRKIITNAIIDLRFPFETKDLNILNQCNNLNVSLSNGSL